MIAADTTLARLFDEHPQLVEFLATYDPHFEKLRNRQLRRMVAPRVTVAEAARMAGVDAAKLVAALRHAVGEPEPAPDMPTEAAPDVGAPRPAALAGIPPARHAHLDVRADIRDGHEPFAKIMAAVKMLAADQALELRTPFEPVPLYSVLAMRGLAHWAQAHAAGDWSVWFYRDGAGAQPADSGAGAAGPAPARTVTIDVRELEPPQPMALVLERLDTLAEDEELEVIHSRRPMFLYPLLDERGFAHVTDEPGSGIVRIVIRRRAA